METLSGGLNKGLNKLIPLGHLSTGPTRPLGEQGFSFPRVPSWCGDTAEGSIRPQPAADNPGRELSLSLFPQGPSTPVPPSPSVQTLGSPCSSGQIFPHCPVSPPPYNIDNIHH